MAATTSRNDDAIVGRGSPLLQNLRNLMLSTLREGNRLAKRLPGTARRLNRYQADGLNVAFRSKEDCKIT